MLLLVQRLPDTSLTMALASGGRDHFGWGVDRYLAADIYDAINLGTRATGNWGKGKAPKFPPWPRPKAKGKDKPKAKDKAAPGKPAKVSVADIYRKFTRR